MRTFNCLLRGLMLTLVGVAFYVSASTYDAPMGDAWKGGPMAHPANQEPNVPSFTAADARQHPDCDADVAHPRPGWRNLLVVDVFGDRYRATYDATRGRTARGIDAWVIGVCY